MKKFVTIHILASVVFLTACSSNVKNKQMDIIINGDVLLVNYTGDTDSGKAANNGSFTVNTDGVSYSGEGEFKEGTLLSGNVTDFPFSFQIDTNSYDGKYTGEIANGYFGGKGVFNCDDISYEGEWVNGKPSGAGKLTNYPFLLTLTEEEYLGTYTGESKDGLPEGEGVFLYDKDDIKVKYNGGWKEGKPYGPGELEDDDFGAWFADEPADLLKGEYLGETNDGSPTTGSFTRINSSGEKYTYTGEWKNGAWNGYGSWIFEDEEIGKSIGNFENGLFKPNISQYILSLGTDGKPFHGISEDNIKFIDENENLFPYKKDSGIDINSYINNELKYKIYIKNPLSQNGMLMKTTKQNVIQITEEDSDEAPGGKLTCMITSDNSTHGDIYYVYYLGSLPDIYEGSKIKMIGLPLDYSSYDNIGGGTTKCIVFLLSSIA